MSERRSATRPANEEKKEFVWKWNLHGHSYKAGNVVEVDLQHAYVG